MPVPTRTLNPLPLEHLEPHRFEDMVRQLAYDLRPWKSIEAVGRLGSDEGMDVRATELVFGAPEASEEDSENEEGAEPPATERTWIIQCKREQSIGPSAARRIVRESIPDGSEPPYGFIVAASADFSLKTRTAFREAILQAGVQEFEIWGRAELEDKLFLPKNDHLLFAYFNISLQVRRRSLRTELRSRLSTKRALIRALGGRLEPIGSVAVLLRDPGEERYPYADKIPQFLNNPAWRYYWFAGHPLPDYVGLVIERRIACLDHETGEWDAIDEVDLSMPQHPKVYGANGWYSKMYGPEGRAYQSREANIPREQHATLEVTALIHYDRILAVDVEGDVFHEGPHLLVERLPDGDFFELKGTHLLGPYNMRVRADPAKRRPRFPRPIPELPPVADDSNS